MNHNEWQLDQSRGERIQRAQDALRLADAAVIEAARVWKAAWHNQRYYPREYEKARESLADAVSAYDKALAEQAKEASRG